MLLVEEEKVAFKLVQGDTENLTGNCVVYWQVKGDNVFSPGSKIIAANFTISALPLEDKLLTATFPPISFLDFDEMTEKIININCDIIEGGAIEFPEKETDFKKFYKQQFYKYNKIIQEYSDKFKDKFDFKPEFLDEKESIYMLRKMLRKVRNNLSEKEVDIDSKGIRIKKLIDDIQTRYSKYDVQKIYRLLYKPGEEIDILTELYINKFLSIYDEDYEKAVEFSKEIEQLEKKISAQL
jgi:hypothetical protein